jgi:hypothetical protein
VKNLVEYYWNEQTEIAEFIYELTASCKHAVCEVEISLVKETSHVPLKINEPNVEIYWSQLKCWLKNEGYNPHQLDQDEQKRLNISWSKLTAVGLDINSGLYYWRDESGDICGPYSTEVEAFRKANKGKK